MANIWSSIFGGGDVIKAGIDLIDDMHTSKEEEIVAKTDAKIRLLESYAAYKVAQRVLGFMFAGTFLFCFALVLGMTLAGLGDVEAARDVIGEFYIAPIVFTIVGFYFGGGAFEGVVDRFKAGPKRK